MSWQYDSAELLWTEKRAENLKIQIQRATNRNKNKMTGSLPMDHVCRL